MRTPYESKASRLLWRPTWSALETLPTYVIELALREIPAVFCSGDAKISCKHELLLLSKLLKLLIYTFCI
jgi:hypothetical protein